jgi:O-antigen/teichoic acid export membrane protein
MNNRSAAETVARPDIDRGDAPPELTATVVGGVAWKALSYAFSEALRIGVVIVLARLLTPEDYGIAGMAMVVVAFMTIFTDPALSAALIQRPVVDEHDRSTVFWFSLVIGVALTLTGFALAGPVSAFFGEPQVRALIQVASVSFTVVSISIVQKAILLRRLEYRSMEIRQMFASGFGAVTAVSVAFAGFGPWAIIGQWLAFSTASTALLWILSGWRPRTGFVVERLRRIASFTSSYFGAKLLAWGNQNADNVIVGRVLGPAPLGAYSLAFNVMYLPVSRISRPLGEVLGPAYARIQGDRARLERAWLQSKRVSIALVVPAFVVILVTAPDLVPFMFGDRWNAAVTPLQLLCLAGIGQSQGTLNWGLLAACGKGGTLLRITLLGFCVTVSALTIGLAWGIVGVAAGFAAAKWLLIVPELWLTTRAVGFRLVSALTAGAVILPISGVAAACAFAVRKGLIDLEGVPVVVRLIAVGATVLLTYFLLVVVLVPSLVFELRDAVKTKRRQRDGTAEPPGSDDATHATA